jgi:TonB family protein
MLHKPRYNPAMRRPLLVILCVTLLTTNAWVQTDELKQYLHDHYVNRIFIIRNFLSGNHLSYDSLGSPTKRALAGDWTETGFVTIGDDPRIEKNHLVLKAQRMIVIFIDKRLQLRAMRDPPRAKIEIELSGTPSSQSVDAVLSRIFLTSHDSFVDLVPDYWRPCVSSGLAGNDLRCAFAPELITMLRAKAESPQPPPKEVSTTPSGDGIFHLDHASISPPKATYAPEPQFTEAARALNFQGRLSVALVVYKDGRPGNFRIVQPLGAGLDARAIQEEQNWRFRPAKKNGEPVAVDIVVETDFSRY